MNKAAVLISLSAFSMGSYAQQTFVVTRLAWEGLSTEERAEIQQSRIVDLRESTSFAIVLDNQGVNESTSGTNGGAALGGAIANAAYIDRALKPQNNYSAKTQLAVGLLGALVGSTMDAAPTTQFHFRYALRRLDGEIESRDVVQRGAFRHPVRMCLDTTTMQPASQLMCSQTANDLRRLYLVPHAPSQITNSMLLPTTTSVPTGRQVQCKLGNLAPVLTTLEKCNLINGEIQ